MPTTDGAAARGSLLELEGPVFDGRFRIEERVAEGGFAIVYKAWQLALDRRVALKVLKPPRNQDAAGRAEFRERFAVEAKTIARLRFPDIVDVYDFSVATLPSGELAPWMALEWLDGETLALQLARRRRSGAGGRDPAEAIDFLRPVLRALAHAHHQGIVHRDVKPSNIMVTDASSSHGVSLRVLDFGIAKIMVDTQAPNTGNTRTESAPAFSPAYAAPEQVAFSRTGPWTDVHALGLILTEVMTDEPPFSEADPEAHLFEQVMAGRRPTPASKGRDVGIFEAIIGKALSLSPRDRWRNAGELLAALDEAKDASRNAGEKASNGVGRNGETSADKSAEKTAARVVVAATTATGAPSPQPMVARAVAIPRPGARARLARPARRALALGALASALATAAWTASVRSPAAVSPAPPVRQSEVAAVRAAELRPPVEPMPASSGAGASPTPAPPAAQAGPPAARLAAKMSASGKEKKRARTARAPVKISDGRDLFNDTK